LLILVVSVCLKSDYRDAAEKNAIKS